MRSCATDTDTGTDGILSNILCKNCIFVQYTVQAVQDINILCRYRYTVQDINILCGVAIHREIHRGGYCAHVRDRWLLCLTVGARYQYTVQCVIYCAIAQYIVQISHIAQYIVQISHIAQYIVQKGTFVTVYQQ